MNTVLLIASGKKYREILFNDYHLIKDQANIVVYTDNVDDIKSKINSIDVRQYTHQTFRYFDKYVLTHLLTKEINAPVLYVDVGRLDYLKSTNYLFFNSASINKVYTNSNWGGIANASELKNHKSEYYEENYWDNILEFITKQGINLKNVIPLLERLFIFPYSSITDKVIHELENIRPLFENNSKFKENVYNGIGNGEGLALGYAFTKLNYKNLYLRDIPVNLKEPYNII